MKILIADDHDLVRETLAAFLERETDIDVYTSEDLQSATAEIRETAHLIWSFWIIPCRA